MRVHKNAAACDVIPIQLHLKWERDRKPSIFRRSWRPRCATLFLSLLFPRDRNIVRPQSATIRLCYLFVPRRYVKFRDRACLRPRARRVKASRVNDSWSGGAWRVIIFKSSHRKCKTTLGRWIMSVGGASGRV